MTHFAPTAGSPKRGLFEETHLPNFELFMAQFDPVQADRPHLPPFPLPFSYPVDSNSVCCGLKALPPPILV